MFDSRSSLLNACMQVGLVGFTMLGVLLTALKLPQYGLIATLLSEIFGYTALIERGKRHIKLAFLLSLGALQSLLPLV